jgi:hypothetical protein
MHRYASSNGVGSHVCYSVKAGCSFFFLSTSANPSYIADAEALRQHFFPAAQDRESMLRERFAVAASETTKAQMDIVDYYLGVEYMKTPMELRQQLQRFEWLDRLGVITHNKGQFPRVAVPCSLERRVKSAVWTSGRLVKRKALRFREMIPELSEIKPRDS